VRGYYICLLCYNLWFSVVDGHGYTSPSEDVFYPSKTPDATSESLTHRHMSRACRTYHAPVKENFALSLLQR